MVEADDAYTGTHSRDVVDLVLAVADELGLDAARRREAEFAALLHDVGKIRIPKEIINKPGPLTPEERAIIGTHTVEGEKLLLRVGGLLGEAGRSSAPATSATTAPGTPTGSPASEIPLVARIVACCDAFNAMTTTAPIDRRGHLRRPWSRFSAAEGRSSTPRWSTRWPGSSTRPRERAGPDPAAARRSRR